MFAIRAPGMIGSGRLWGRQAAVEMLGVDHRGLRGEFFEGGVSQWFVFVEDHDFSFGIFTDCDGCLLQGIDGTFSLDLVNDLVVLQGQVFGEVGLFLPGQDPIEIVGRQQGTMRIMGAARLDCKAPIEVCPILR